jgi:hypothetical protein
MIFDAHQRMIHDLAEVKRKTATSDRMGTVTDVKQEGGEQKIRVEMGLDPDGKPIKGPWMSTVDKRGASREQHQYKKGQNVRISGADGDYRQATVSAWAEGKSFPQPDSAPEHGYGDSYQAGKLHTGQWLPEEKDDQKKSDSQAGGAGGGGQSGGQEEEKNHRHEVWIAKEDNKPPKHTGESKVESSEYGGSSAKQPQQQQQQQKEKKLEAAVMHSVDEKNGFTARVGEDIRVAAHPQGAKTVAGKTYYSAKKDDDSTLVSEKDHYARAKQNLYYMAEKGNPYINKPWQIKEKKKDDEVPNDNQLGNKKSKSK